MKILNKYTPVVVLFLFILGMVLNCLQLSSGTGDPSYIILIIIPTYLFVICFYVAFFKIRKETEE